MECDSEPVPQPRPKSKRKSRWFIETGLPEIEKEVQPENPQEAATTAGESRHGKLTAPVYVQVYAQVKDLKEKQPQKSRAQAVQKVKRKIIVKSRSAVNFISGFPEINGGCVGGEGRGGLDFFISGFG